MNLHEYYRSHKEAINTSIMEIACDLAVGRLLSAHDAPFETFVEADDPDDPDGQIAGNFHNRCVDRVLMVTVIFV